MAKYLKVDSRKITLREYWNVAPRTQYLLLILLKLLRIPLKFGSGFRQMDSVQELEIPEAEFSPLARARLQPTLEQSLALGFHSPRFYCFATLHGETQTSFISLLDPQGECGLRLMHTATTPPPPATKVKQKALTVLLSELSDGRPFVTSDQKPQFDNRPEVIVNRMVGAPVAQLVEAHRRKLDEFRSTTPPKTLFTTEALDEVSGRYEKAASDFGIKRGRYVELSAQVVAEEQAKLQSFQTFKEQGVANAAILAEMEHLQNKKADWGNALVIFVISIVLFLGAGSQQWSLKSVLLIIPILFIHELGHYLTMRLFDYRNLRMFFIPFFGAAVSGRHYNVPGWKKVVVSLMGPVPGIVLGCLVAAAGIAFHQPALIKVALVALILNGINLAPVLPLDGGWVVHSLLFSRHQLLDAIFRVLAVIALLAYGLNTGNKIMLYLAIPMAMGIPPAYRLAKITAELRILGVEPNSSDNQTVPVETAQIIIAEVKKAAKTPLSNRVIAQQSLDIFERLNARPPGWLATIGLLFVHVGSVVLAIAFIIVIFAAKGLNLTALTNAYQAQPKHAITCAPMLTWQGSDAGGLYSTNENTIVATLPKSRSIETAFQSLTNRLPVNATLTVFGNTLLLTLPGDKTAERRTWLKELQGLTKDAFVDNSNFPARFTLTCIAPSTNVAHVLESELSQYLFNSEGMFLLPPWMLDSKPPETRAGFLKARATYTKAQAVQWEGMDTPAFKKISKKMTEAQKLGDQDELIALRKQNKEMIDEIQKKNLESLRSGGEEPADITMLDLYASLPMDPLQTNIQTKAIIQKMATRMGQLSLIDGKPSPLDVRLTTRSGGVEVVKTKLTLSWFSFHRLIDGAPALINWLCANGCTDFKYDFMVGPSLDEEEKE